MDKPLFSSARRIRVDAQTRLEWLKPAHAGPLFRLVDENRAFLTPWLAFVPHATSEAFIARYIQGSRRRHRAGQEWAYLIMGDARPMGRVGLYKVDPVNRSAELGYWVGKEYQGKGVITASCRALMDVAFGPLGLHRLEIRCAEANFRSRAVAERLGFREEGVLRDAEYLNGAWHHLVVYGRCADDPAL